ncbi:hypothetical protein DFH06DRAFT_1134213 [Mycena polygramma]|nr:hypothetical protein DFH06DRAFT_1134213 [Mycena polygramma]
MAESRMICLGELNGCFLTNAEGKLVLFPRTFAEGTRAKPYSTITVDTSDLLSGPGKATVPFNINKFDAARIKKNCEWKYLVDREQPTGPVHVTFRGKSLAFTAGPNILVTHFGPEGNMRLLPISGFNTIYKFSFYTALLYHVNMSACRVKWHQEEVRYAAEFGLQTLRGGIPGGNGLPLGVTHTEARLQNSFLQRLCMPHARSVPFPVMSIFGDAVNRDHGRHKICVQLGTIIWFF